MQLLVRHFNSSAFLLPTTVISYVTISKQRTEQVSSSITLIPCWLFFFEYWLIIILKISKTLIAPFPIIVFNTATFWSYLHLQEYNFNGYIIHKLQVFHSHVFLRASQCKWNKISLLKDGQCKFHFWKLVAPPKWRWQ